MGAVLLEIGDFPMMRKMLTGIRSRVNLWHERHRQTRLEGGTGGASCPELDRVPV